MTEQMRKGLGLIAVAAIALVVFLLFRGGDSEFAQNLALITLLAAVVLGLAGLIRVATDLLRN